MNAWTSLSAIILSLALTTAYAQTTDPAKPPAAAPKAAAETPADRKAYQDALKIADPKEKIDALEKFKKDFPDSTMAQSATMNIFSTLAQKLPQQTVRIQQLADAIYRAADKKDQGRVAGQLADTLLASNLLLRDASKYARKSLESLDQAEYLKDQKASYNKRKATVPSDEELIKRFKQSRATRVALLGRIQLKQGKKAEAQKLLEESYAVNPNAPAVSGALGELALNAGNEPKALDYLIPARLSGKAPETSAAALESIYRKNHNGSLDGFDAMLDAEYRKRSPSPIHAQAVKTIEKRSDRLVLAEVFTGSGCPPCVGADLAFEAAMERYGPKNLAVVMYHQHIPQPDPMSNPDTVARYKYYTPQGVPTYRVDGAPVLCVEDGNPVECSGDNRDGAKDIYGHLQLAVDRELIAAADTQLKVQASVAGDSVKVTAAVSGIRGDFKDVRVQVLLLEKELRYSGENGVRFHPMVVRAMGGEKDDGFVWTSGAAASFEQTFDLEKIGNGLKTYLDEYEAHPTRGNPFKFIEKKHQIDGANMAVVVFVQDVASKHVLQSAYVDLNPQPVSLVTTEPASGAK
jgi:thiol-disulfide isomerase/thioredoxin